MIGRMRIMPWRQCNAVSPVVTATQTGAGTHNGMALTVKVVNGAAITVTGPQYQSTFNPGATGSADATAPADVLLIPQGSGSLVYGAVNRNDASTAWTPVAGTTFFQNVSDTTNGAAYGTFTSGSMSPTVAFDAVGPSSSGAGNTGAASLSWSHTVSGVNTVVLAAVSLGGGADSLCTVTATCGGTPMAAAGVVHAGGTNKGFVEVFVLAGVPAGVNTIALTVAGATPDSLAAGSLSFTGADQAAIIGSSYTGYGSGASASVTVSSNTNGNIIAAFAGGGSAIGSVSGPSASRYLINEASTSGCGNGAGQTAPATGAPVVMTRALTTDLWAMIAVEVLSLSPFTTANVAITTGASNGAAGTAGGVAVAEIRACPWYSVAEDPSSPPPVTTTSATSVSTARFTPPMGSLLVAMVATAGTGAGVSVTDDNGMLTWVEQVRWASGTSGYAGVWTAVVVCG